MYDSGTDEYISNLVRKYSPALLRAAFSVLRNTADAQDAAQEAFLRLLQKRRKLTRSHDLQEWRCFQMLRLILLQQQSAG